jgi:hypothetical protein
MDEDGRTMKLYIKVLLSASLIGLMIIGYLAFRHQRYSESQFAIDKAGIPLQTAQEMGVYPIDSELQAQDHVDLARDSENSSSVLEQPATSAERRNALRELWWPQPPDTTSSLISIALAETVSGILNIDTIECDETTCEANLLVADGSQLDARELAEAPSMLSAGVAMVTTESNRLTGGGAEYSVLLTSYASYMGSPSYTADDLFRFAGPAPRKSFRTRPIVVGSFDGVDVIQSFICGFDCPNDTRSIVTLGVAEGKTCKESGGIERRISSQSELGMREMVVCMPAVFESNSDLSPPPTRNVQ